MKKTVKTNAVIDWSAVDAMTDEQLRAAAMADPDAVPMIDEEWAEAPRVTLVKTIRRALKLSQEEFAASFHIPIGTLRDWSKGARSPTRGARLSARDCPRAGCGAQGARPAASVNRVFHLLNQRFLEAWRM